MTENSRYLRLSRMLDPGKIVFVGGQALIPAIEYCRELGFKGEIFVVNPRREQICDISCVSSANQLEADIDLAFVAVPAAAVVAAVRDLATAGVGAAIINSSGFSETGVNGRQLEVDLLAASGEMPLLGPNCPGFANFADRCGAMLGHMGDSHSAKGVAVISNGGAYLADITGSDRSLPVSYIAGLGNQADISIAEIFDVMLDDDRVTAVNLHFEGICDVARLSEAALKAHQKGIPVVVVKGGKSGAGGRAAQTHTASLTGAAEIASALFKRLGFVEAESAGEAMETLKMLTLTAAPRGPRIGYTTSSGTYAVMGADFAEKNDLVIPEISNKTYTRLQPLIGEFLTPNNPLDIATGQFLADAQQLKIFTALLADDFDIAVQSMSFPAAGSWDDESWYRSAKMFAAAARAAELPAVFVSPTHEGLPATAREMLIEQGVAPLQGFEFGMKAIAQALDWHQRRKRLRADNLLLPPTPGPTAQQTSILDEVESKALLADFGISVPRGRRLGANDDLPADLEYPVVLKVCDASIPHKTDVGGVSLNLVNAELLNFAREQMSAVLKAQGHRGDSFLVEESILGGVAELLVGIRRVPEIGLCLTLAIGGTVVEWMQDSVSLLLPSGRDEIADALTSLKLYPMLAGLRGNIGVDMEITLDTIQTIAAFIESRSDIVELEINPLILRSTDYTAVAADAILKIKPQ